jgi:lipopolysaccharide transport system ATP-binding protein
VAHSISVQGLSKQYRLGDNDTDLLYERLVNWLKRPFSKNGIRSAQTLWALRDVSLEVDEGEVVGVIGRNGAGKSTLLKVLSRITYPTSGRVDVNGRVAALLEVGTGFHGDLTGRENILLNGSILGMRRREIEAKLDAIVSFAGVEKFLDTPVKRYSSGMFLRLGFAVAAHLEPDVLLVDEVLAVGDAAFQKKCLNAMNELRSGGRTVLFVSHNMAAVENLCSRCVWIDEGCVLQDGTPKDVIEAYMSTNADASRLTADLLNVRNRRGNGDVRFTKLEFLGGDGSPLKFLSSGDRVIVRLHYEATKQISRPDFEVGIYTDLGTLVTRFSTWIDYQIPSISSGPGHLDLAIDCFSLLPGRYYLSLWLKIQGPTFFDVLEHCLQFEVEASDFYGSGRGIHRYFGIVFLPCRWQLRSNLVEPESVECASSAGPAEEHSVLTSSLARRSG